MISPNAAIGQLLSDTWAMEPHRLDGLVSQLTRPRAQGFGPSGEQSKATYQVDEDGAAHIAIRGVMLKEVPWIFEWLGIAAVSTVDTREALGQALADPKVKSITLDIDSPGGQVQGVQELADDVFRAQGQKPTRAVVSDTAASAAYWVASQAETIEANKGALVGSIGVYAVLYDASKMASDQGIKVHVVRSADLKGIGASDLEELTDERLASVQREVSAFAALFVEEVARGRNVSIADIEKSATGETWLATEAKRRGLIDQVGAMAADEDEEDKDDDEEEKPPKDEEDGEDEAADPDPDEDEEEEAADPVDEEDDDEEEAADPEEDEEEDDEGDDKKKQDPNAPSSASTKGANMAKKTAPDAKGATISPDKARADAAEAQLAELRKVGCMDMIEAAAKAGCVLPPARKHVEAHAESLGWDSGKLKTYLSDTFPSPQTHPERDTTDPETDNADAKTGVDAEAAELEDWLKIPKEAQKKFEGVAMVTPDGKLLDNSGEEVIR